MKELTNKILLALAVVLTLYSCKNLKSGQKPTNDNSEKLLNEISENSGRFRIMFYNAENFFDTKHDTMKWDDEFLPTGKKYWTERKFWEKVNHLAKVITSVGAWDPPAIIGMCEVENRYVLEQLVHHSPIKNINYRIIHKESPDRRGIDVAFLYRKEKFRPLSYHFYPINFPFNKRSKTRDLLYVKGIVENSDTIHVFVNHWPSRWGGQQETEPKRMFVAKTLRTITDSIFDVNPKSNIFIMGDFNDEPENKSLREVLYAHLEFTPVLPDTALYNLIGIIQKRTGQGTHKYHGTWGVLDQIIVSGALLNKQNKIYTAYELSHIFKADFLLEPDERYTGKRLNRTYIGYKYHGGFSDHLPVYADILLNKK